MDISAPKQTKRLALFLDGTWNEEVDNTSVWRLRSLCAPMATDGTPQLIYYDTGLGTHFGEKIRGGIYGFGIDENARKAYGWLVENYNDDDEVFIFGFSRGAFTARCLAGLISICASFGQERLWASDSFTSVWDGGSEPCFDPTPIRRAEERYPAEPDA